MASSLRRNQDGLGLEEEIMSFWENWNVAIVAVVGTIVGSMIAKRNECWILLALTLIVIFTIEGFSRSGIVNSILFIFMVIYILYLKKNEK